MKRMNLSSDGESAKGNFRGRWFESNRSLSFIFFCLKVKEDISNEDGNEDNYFFGEDKRNVYT